MGRACDGGMWVWWMVIRVSGIEIPVSQGTKPDRRVRRAAGANRGTGWLDSARLGSVGDQQRERDAPAYRRRGENELKESSSRGRPGFVAAIESRMFKQSSSTVDYMYS